MRRILAAAALVAFMPTAHAQDKGKSDFTHNAEFRVRDTYEQNESGDKNLKPAQHNGINQRFKLGLGFKANEKFSMNATLIQASAWGTSDTQSAVGHTGDLTGGEDENVMTVNEAYGTWMMSEDLNAKLGRMNFGFGDGSVMAVNDWEQQPNAFEGVLVNYEAEFGRFHAFAFKYRDRTLAATPTTLTSDPQHDAYGVVFDLKTMPEWLKSVNAFVIQDVADGDTATTADSAGVQGKQGTNALRYGATGSFGFSMVDLRATYVGVTGKDLDQGVAAPNDKHDIKQSMMEAEVGVNLAAFMGSRLYVAYHQDSGTKPTDALNTTTSSKHNTYDSYFYDKHANAGLMDIVGWGNLTDTSFGWTGKPMDSTDVGVAYHMFAKTEKGDTTSAATASTAGTMGSNLFSGGTAKGKGNLGNEVDLWANHKYDGGLMMSARLGMFMPGNAFKDITATDTRKDTITQLSVEGKWTF